MPTIKDRKGRSWRSKKEEDNQHAQNSFVIGATMFALVSFAGFMIGLVYLALEILEFFGFR